MTLEEVSFEYLLVILKENGGNKLKTAKYLNISASTIRNHLRKIVLKKRYANRVEEIYRNSENIGFAEKKSEEKERDASFWRFVSPTNEERLAYRDNFPNRYRG